MGAWSAAKRRSASETLPEGGADSVSAGAVAGGGAGWRWEQALRSVSSAVASKAGSRLRESARRVTRAKGGAKAFVSVLQR